MSPQSVEAITPPDPAAGSAGLSLPDQQAPSTPDQQAASTSAAPVPADSRSPRFVAELPLGLVIGGVIAGLMVIAMHHFRWGNVMIGASVLGGAVARLVLPTRQAGLLVVRSRGTDVITMSAIGGSLLLLALVTRT